MSTLSLAEDLSGFSKGIFNTEGYDFKKLLPKPSKNLKKVINAGMISSLPISIIGGFAGATKLHIVAGAAFMGFLGLHLYGRNRII
jgi:hypothetical protein